LPDSAAVVAVGAVAGNGSTCRTAALGSLPRGA